MTEQGNDHQTADIDADWGSPEYMAQFADRVRTPLLPDEGDCPDFS
ncbi:hypothetical protein [Blastococcus sp. TF02A-30]|nr:hypothetical protein [Blastococcus sp. TF02A-30]